MHAYPDGKRLSKTGGPVSRQARERLSILSHGALPARAIPIRGAREGPVPRDHGDRLLRQPGVAGSDIRRKPRRAVVVRNVANLVLNYELNAAYDGTSAALEF